MRSLLSSPMWYLITAIACGFWLFGLLPMKPPEWLTEGSDVDPIISSRSSARAFYLFTMTLVLANFSVWFPTALMRRRFPLRDIVPMLRIGIVSRRGVALLLTVIAYLALTTMWVFYAGGTPNSYFVRINFLVAVGGYMPILMPPTAIVLASSSPVSGRLLEDVVRHALPLRVVSLLDESRIGKMMLENEIDNLRTIQAGHWRDTVHRLVETTPIIVVDARSASPPVCEEVEHMLDPSRMGRAVFVLNDDDSAPAFDAVRPEWKEINPVRCYARELPRVMKSFKRTGTVYPLMQVDAFRWYPMRCSACDCPMNVFVHKWIGLVVWKIRGQIREMVQNGLMNRAVYCQRCKQIHCDNCSDPERKCRCTEGPAWGESIYMEEK